MRGELPAGTKLDVVRHRELMALLDDIRAHPAHYPVLPIDAPRAALHAANPDADPDDPSLLLVRVDGQCRAYLGLTPQFIAHGNGNGKDKVFAFSTLLVDAPLRGAGIADRLLEGARAFGPLLTIGNSNAAQGFFRKRGLLRLPPYRVVYLPIGAGHGWSRLRGGLLRRLNRRGLPRLSVFAGDLFDRLRPLAILSRPRHLRRLREHLPVEAERNAQACDRVPDACESLLDRLAGRVVWRVATINWLLDCGAAGRVEGQALPGQYHFRFDGTPRSYHACLLREAGVVRGLAVYLCHRIHGQWTVSILKAFLPDESWRGLVVAHALDLAAGHGGDVIRGGDDFEALFTALRDGRPAPVRLRQAYADAPAEWPGFDDYQESFADGDIALY